MTPTPTFADGAGAFRRTGLRAPAAGTSRLLGLGTADAHTFLRALRDRRALRSGIDLRLVEQTVEQRSAARAAKDYALADQLQPVRRPAGILINTLG